jgi:hypothetical protein
VDAASNGNVRKVEQLLAAGADVNGVAEVIYFGGSTSEAVLSASSCDELLGGLRLVACAILSATVFEMSFPGGSASHAVLTATVLRASSCDWREFWLCNTLCQSLRRVSLEGVPHM